MEEIICSTWDDFRNATRRSPFQGSLWRGQSDRRWVLASAFERWILQGQGGKESGLYETYPYGGRFWPQGRLIWDRDFYQSMRDSYLTHFKRFATGCRGPHTSALDDSAWWALGRHYELTTPLLDWSESPFIAAFFAVMERYRELLRQPQLIIDSREFHVAIYELNLEVAKHPGPLKVIRPNVDEASRIHSQLGWFTWLDSERHFEIEGFLNDYERHGNLRKYVLSDSGLLCAVSDLHRHGINYRSVFPDLVGAALCANWRLDVFNADIAVRQPDSSS